MLEIVSSERLEQWISDSYSCACSHGFHDVELSKKHCLMLVMSGLGEVVEADRKGKYADMRKYNKKYVEYEKLVQEETRFRCAFESCVMSSVQDELADVCIRLFDFCGAFGIELDVTYDEEMRLTWKEMFGEQSLCENCFELASLLCDLDEHKDEGEGIGCVLSFAFCMCYWMGIHIDKHIDLKMRYNRLREPLHGKKY